jgi:hypothetical protein
VAADKARGSGNESASETQQEAERYRQAAEDALGQLDWCIEYLHEIRKGPIARTLSKNRTSIRNALRAADLAAARRGIDSTEGKANSS